MTPARPRRGIQIDSDAVRFATGEDAAAPAPAKAPAGKGPAGKAPAAKPAAPKAESRKQTSAKTETAPPARNPDALEGELFPGEERIKIGTVLPKELKRQIDGFINFSQMTQSDEDLPIDSSGAPMLTFVDFIRVATNRLLLELQEEHNDGKPFDVPRINKRGRPAGR